MSLNCPGIDTDKFRATCRCPLYPGRWNRWILCRSTRDNPTHDKLLTSTAQVFAKWFQPNSPWGWLISPRVSYDIQEGPRAGAVTTSAGEADLIIVSRVASESISWPVTAPSRLRCEPLPLLTPGGVVWIAVEFVYRGTALTMDWPCYKEPSLLWPTDPWCPVDADFMLDSVGYPPDEAAPAPRTSAEKVKETLGNAVTEHLAPYAPIAGIGGMLCVAGITIGAVLILKVCR